MTGRITDTNFQIYEAPEVAAHYAALGLSDALRARYCSIPIFRWGARFSISGLVADALRLILRTALHAMSASITPPRWSGLAREVSRAGIWGRGCGEPVIFPDASFDVVVFAFNGIDYVLPEQSRQSCLAHIRRVLKGWRRLDFLFSQCPGSPDPPAVEPGAPAANRAAIRGWIRRFCTGSG